MTIAEIERLQAALDAVKPSMLGGEATELLQALVPFVREALEGKAPEDYRSGRDAA